MAGFGLEWVLADEHFFEAEAEDVGAAGVDHGLGDPGVGVDFADAGDAFVGVDENDDVVLGGGAGVAVKAGVEEDVGFDVGDFHAGLAHSLRYYRRFSVTNSTG
jgi:hypothetical protein